MKKKADSTLREEVTWLVNRGFYAIAFQPIINARSMKIFGFEALMRGPEGTPLANPGRVFNKKGYLTLPLLYKLDMACMGAAIRAGRHLDNRAKIFINLHGVSLKKISEKHDLLYNLLEETGIAPDRIVFEISENTHPAHVESIAESFREFRRSGIALAIDDIGLRYPWLQYFYWLEPDYVKIDKYLIRNIDSDSRKQSLVNWIATIGKQMCCKVVAEGIETIREWMVLEDLGFELAQGYYFGKPQSVDKWLDLFHPGSPKFAPVNGISSAMTL